MTDAYVFQAALYCEDCGAAIRKRLQAEGSPYTPDTDEYAYDSDEYPKGPYCDGGGEADYACHCDACNAFLENPLTPDGEQHVRECHAERPSVVTRTWMEFYDLAPVRRQRRRRAS